MSSFIAGRHTIPSKRPHGVAVDLHGTGTTWSGSTTFTLSGVAGTSVLTKIVTSSTQARLAIITGPSTGTLTISDGSTSTTVKVRSTAPVRRWFPGLDKRERERP